MSSETIFENGVSILSLEPTPVKGTSYIIHFPVNACLSGTFYMGNTPPPLAKEMGRNKPGATSGSWEPDRPDKGHCLKSAKMQECSSAAFPIPPPPPPPHRPHICG